MKKFFELAIEAGAMSVFPKIIIHEIQCTVSEIYNVKKN